ncbi:MAG: hypothetical protein SGILL_008327 [Bacillariaceae sp.]
MTVLRRNRKPQSRKSGLRQVTTRKDTVRLILVLCLPQIVIQLFNTIYTDYYVAIEYSQDLQNGRQACFSQFNVNWALYVGVGMLAMMHLLACYVAYCSRTLPSAFNEKEQVFTSTMINVVVSVCLIGLLGFFDVGKSDPNIATCITVTLVVAISVTTNIFVVLPKIKRVRSGDEVVITNVLRDMTGVRQGVSLTVDSRLQNTAQFHRTSTHCEAGEPVVRFLKPSEAIPRRMEQHIYELKLMINRLSREAAEGRPVQKELWIAFTEANSAMAQDIRTHKFLWRENAEENGDSDGNALEQEQSARALEQEAMAFTMAMDGDDQPESEPETKQSNGKHVSIREDL